MIEHLPRPDDAIRLFQSARRSSPGGAFSDPSERRIPEIFSGLVAKYTPIGFTCGSTAPSFTARTPANPGLRFPVVFHRIVDPDELRAFCKELGLRLVAYSSYESPNYRKIREGWPLLGSILHSFNAILTKLACDHRDPSHGAAE